MEKLIAICWRGDEQGNNKYGKQTARNIKLCLRVQKTPQ
jgi:hypothetical protein